MEIGYSRMHRLSIVARADMLETVAGYQSSDVDRELKFAIATLDENDTASLRWLACLLERRIIDLEGEKHDR